MSFKVVAFYLGCAAAWFILLPAFVIGGGVALILYAVFSEIREFFPWARKSTDVPNAREIARRMCYFGH
jgi:hypothetical protein